MHEKMSALSVHPQSIDANTLLSVNARLASTAISSVPVNNMPISTVSCRVTARLPLSHSARFRSLVLKKPPILSPVIIGRIVIGRMISATGLICSGPYLYRQRPIMSPSSRTISGYLRKYFTLFIFVQSGTNSADKDWFVESEYGYDCAEYFMRFGDHFARELNRGVYLIL